MQACSSSACWGPTQVLAAEQAPQCTPARLWSRQTSIQQLTDTAGHRMEELAAGRWRLLLAAGHPATCSVRRRRCLTAPPSSRLTSAPGEYFPELCFE